MLKLIIVTLITLLTVPAFAAGAPKTEEQKTLYSIGVYQARQLAMFNLTPAEFAMMRQGFVDAGPGKKPVLDAEAYGKKVQELAQARRAAKGTAPGTAKENSPKKTDGVPKTEEQKTLYSIGVYQARRLAMFNLTAQEFEMVQQGVADSAPGKKPVLDVEAYGKKVQELAQSRRAAQGAQAGSADRNFLAKAAAEKGAVKTGSGLVFFSQREGDGAVPTPTSAVKVHYRGTLIDGKEFDNSINLRKPAEFKLDGVIKCWSEGLQKMKAGGKAKLVCPSELAYGPQGVESVIPPNATLIFEIELLEVNNQQVEPTGAASSTAPAK